MTTLALTDSFLNAVKLMIPGNRLHEMGSPHRGVAYATPGFLAPCSALMVVNELGC